MRFFFKVLILLKKFKNFVRVVRRVKKGLEVNVVVGVFIQFSMFFLEEINYRVVGSFYVVLNNKFYIDVSIFISEFFNLELNVICLY